VQVLVPRRTQPQHLDVTAALHEPPHARSLRLPVVADAPDPFAAVEV
jgi:hypothetical protein